MNTINGHLSFVEKEFIDIKLEDHKGRMTTGHLNDLQRKLIENAVEARIMKLCDEDLFELHDNVDEVLKAYPDIEDTENKEVIEKRRGSLWSKIVNKWYQSKTLYKNTNQRTKQHKTWKSNKTSLPYLGKV